MNAAYFSGSNLPVNSIKRHSSVRFLLIVILAASFFVVFFSRLIIEKSFIGAIVPLSIFSLPTLLVLIVGRASSPNSRFGTFIMTLLVITTSLIMMNFAFQPKIYNDPTTKKMREIDQRDFEKAIQDRRDYEKRVKESNEQTMRSFDK